MNFDTIKAYLGEPIENIYSKDYEDEIVGYAYDGIKFYLESFDSSSEDKDLVYVILLDSESYYISFLDFQIGKTRFQDVADFFDVTNGNVYSTYSSEELSLFCDFPAEMYMPESTYEILRKNASFMVVFTFDSKSQLLTKCQLSIDWGI